MLHDVRVSVDFIVRVIVLDHLGRSPNLLIEFGNYVDRSLEDAVFRCSVVVELVGEL